MTKDRFLRTYANLPEDVRREIIVIINKKPYSWNAAFIEVKNNTKLADNIIKKLSAMELI